MSTAETATTPGESSGTDEPTRAEYCVISCADIFAGAGEIMASPMAPTPLLGARLARLTTEPDLLITDGPPPVFGAIAARYDLMNDAMSGACHRPSRGITT